MSHVEVKVGVRNAAFRSGLEEARSSVKKFSTDIKGMFAGAFAAGAVVAGISSIIEKGDQIGDLAQRFRISAEELQRLGFAGQASGTSMEAVAKSIAKLRQSQAEAVEKSGETRDAFAAMGITLEQLRSMPTEELFYRVANGVQAATSETEKLSLASSVFGSRMAGEMIPMLELGGEKIRELGGSAGVMSEDTIAALSAAKDEVERLQQTLTVAFGWIIGNLLTPAINVVKTLGVVFAVNFGMASTAVGQFAKIFGAALSGNWSDAYKQVRDFGQNFRREMENTTVAASEELVKIWQKPAGSPKPEQATANAMPQRPDAETQKAEAELAAEREKNARAQMNRQELINSLQEEYNRLLAEAEKLTGAEKTKKLTDAEQTKGKLDAAQKVQADEQAKADEQLAAEKARNAEANETRPQRIARLRAEAKKLEKEAEGLTGVERTQKLTEAEKFRGRIASEEKSQADELARAKESEAAVTEQNQLAGMTKGQRRDYFRRKQSRLIEEANVAETAGDELTATQKRTAAKQLQGEIAPAKNEDRPALTVDSLTRVGGGGNVGSFSDPVLREQERQTGLLQRIADALDGQGTPPPPATLAP